VTWGLRAAPLLLAFVIIGTCSSGDGFFFKMHFGRVTVTASHCG
jgi:hypothetical protein